MASMLPLMATTRSSPLRVLTTVTDPQLLLDRPRPLRPGHGGGRRPDWTLAQTTFPALSWTGNAPQAWAIRSTTRRP
jgi:hypothetical protein